LPAHLYDLPKRGFVSPIQRYIDRIGAPPKSAFVADPTAIEELWRRRSEPAAANLLLRIDVLKKFAAAA
jgi:hypothetical protein